MRIMTNRKRIQQTKAALLGVLCSASVMGLGIIPTAAFAAEPTAAGTGAESHALAPSTTPDVPNWNLSGDLYIGGMKPSGAQTDAGMSMGGAVDMNFQSNGRAVLVFADIRGEGFNNSGSAQDIQFSRFAAAAGLMLGTENVKWITPANIKVTRDVAINQEVAVQYSFSGLYLKLINPNADPAATHHMFETLTNFVYSKVSYLPRVGEVTAPCVAPTDPSSPASDPKAAGCVEPSPDQIGPYDRDILGLEAALRYEIERNGWGSQIQVALLQDLSLGFSDLQSRLVGFKNLSGDLKVLRPYIEVSGILDHDAIDPTGKWQGAVRFFGGISGRFDF